MDIWSHNTVAERGLVALELSPGPGHVCSSSLEEGQWLPTHGSCGPCGSCGLCGPVVHVILWSCIPRSFWLCY